MKLSEYRETHSWQQAMELSPQLLRLAEELPAAEEMGLSLQLRTLMVELPAALAADLLHDRDVQLMNVLKLTTALELIDQVYPALDTAGARAAADKLADRLISGNAADRADGVRPEPKPVATPLPAPSSVPVLPESAAADAEAASAEMPPPTKIAVTPTGDAPTA